MNLKMPKVLLGIVVAALVIFFGGARFRLHAAKANVAGAAPPASIPTFSTEDIARTGFLYVGGHYVGEGDKHYLVGAMYVEVWVPKQIRQPYPIVFFHGAGQTSTDWLETADYRPGWAYYLMKQGYVLYMPDYPARGRSPYVPNFDGPLTIRSVETIEETYTDSAELGKSPRAQKASQWPGGGPNKGKMGDPVFDQFYKTQVQFVGGGEDDGTAEVRDAYVALLDRIGHPVILLTHSQGGGIGWPVADARPNLVKGIVAIEPAGPPMQNVDRVKVEGHPLKTPSWGVATVPLKYDPPLSSPSELQVVREEKSDGPGFVPCILQKEPARKLVNLEHIPVLITTGDASSHYVYDECTAKWLNQAGVKTVYLPLDKVGIYGNAHESMIEKNSDDVIKFLDGWIQQNVH